MEEEIKTQAEEMAEANGLDVEVNQAYIEVVGEEYATADNCQEAYQGKFSNDEDFARDMAESTGAMPKDNQWPMYCIDWEWAGRELMMDYTEQDGYYFRNL